ncbi:putative bifunctional diguanylate cyclase/phosphodiesterase [Bauldia litoralis]|uniref:Diguanylate cyclase (GGDEF) domain-containing protein n=2 Tax=Hyphomicrobiales TaxID=356 RepID=A0A1G6CG64_9HYPH|nr:bifunctional diguanylate cyclase/phosphodiesterase [Bauldia litoralis]SDB31896.1 diguanylate cyclase (GGDEF) domain-containing protein [Bauldia litoralis]
MNKAITGRITLNLIAGIVITVVTVVVAIFWMAARQNEQAAHSTETMVIGGVQAMTRRAESLANDYGWWDDAYDAYVDGDAEWMEANIGASVEETEIADLMAIVASDAGVDYGWLLSDDLAASDVISPEVVAGIRELAKDMPVESLAARSSFVKAGSDVMLIAVSRLTPLSRASEVDAETRPYFVVGIVLSEERLIDLGRSFLIEDLHLEETSPASGSENVSPPVVDLFGNTIAHFVWTPPTPGYAVLRNVLLPVSVALALFCVVAFTTAFRARRIAIALSDSEKEAVIAARTDSMTSLMNRAGFTELIESEEYEQACANGKLAIIYMDINGFKAVNDSIGHHGGDELVRVLANRVTSVLPPEGRFARIGGDEFAVVITGDSVREKAANAAATVVGCLDQPFTIHGFEFHVTVAVGYAIAGGTGLTPSEIVRRADIAMYQAKNGAEREAVLYNSTMETGALEKKQIETSLRRAIELGELQVFYQPVVRASDLTIVGMEALVRWTSKELGTVSPATFVPVAEETGLIHDLGRFVVDRACQDVSKWPGLKMAINLSPVQLRDPDFATGLLEVVRSYGLDPSSFELELTEGILVNNPTIAKRKLAKLKEMGFTLSLDDFGTGFSSIGYLRQFPFDVLKVDRSFVRDIGLNATANALIQSLVSLGDAMNLSVIAEGIENEDQLKLLRLVQCEYVQGYLISRPIPAEQITDLLKTVGEERRILLEAGRDDRRLAAG